jgi:hypothetical protein
MTKDLARWRVLEGGFDELHLWELPGVHTYYGFADIPEKSPDVGLDDVQEALVEALMTGCVRLFDTSDESWLDDETALAAARDAASFEVGTAPREIALAITEIGEEASGEAWERYRSAAGF